MHNSYLFSNHAVKVCEYTPAAERQNLKPQQYYHVGDSISFECVVGYTSLANPTSTCTASGWNPPIPTCQSELRVLFQLEVILLAYVLFIHVRLVSRSVWTFFSSFVSDLVSDFWRITNHTCQGHYFQIIVI